MRRLVGVKLIFYRVGGSHGFLSAESPLSPPFYPRSVRRCSDVSLNGGYSIYPSFKVPAF